MNRNLFTKVLSLLALLTLLTGTLSPPFAVSAATTENLVYVGQGSSKEKSNPIQFAAKKTYVKGYSGATLTVDPGERPFTFTRKTGTPVYCIEPGQYLGWSVDCTTTNSTDLTTLRLKDLTKDVAGRQKLNAVAAVIAMAENAEKIASLPRKNATGNNYNAMGVVQVIVWELILGYRDAITGRVNTTVSGGSSTPLYTNLKSTGSNPDWYKGYYSDVTTLLQKFLTTPSFMVTSAGSSAIKTYKWTWNNTKKRDEVTLPVDTTNGGLSVVNSLTYKLGNTTLSHEKVGNNQVRLYSTQKPTGTVSVDLNYSIPTSKNISGLVFNDSKAGVQQAVASLTPTGHTGYFNLAVDTGGLTLTKKDSAGTVIRGGYRVGILDVDLETVCRTVGWDVQEIRTQITAFENRLAYRQLKKAAAEQGCKLIYRVMSQGQMEQLQTVGVLCVGYDTRDGQKNVAMLPSDLPAYHQIAETPEQRNLRIYAEIKQQAVAAGTNPVYRIMSPEQLEAIQKLHIQCAYFPKGTMMNVAMTTEEWDRLQDRLREQSYEQQRTQTQEQEQGKKHNLRH